jgi:nucleoid-associated protein YgaU
MRSKYVWAMGVVLMVGLTAGCKQNEEKPVTMAPEKTPPPAYPEPPLAQAPAPADPAAENYNPPVDTTPIPGEERPAARSGSRTAGRSSGNARTTTPRSHYASSSKSGKSYTVKKGDTLQEISQKFYGTTRQWRKIYDANRSRIKGGPDKLTVGTKLTIPAK